MIFIIRKRSASLYFPTNQFQCNFQNMIKAVLGISFCMKRKGSSTQWRKLRPAPNSKTKDRCGLFSRKVSRAQPPAIRLSEKVPKECPPLRKMPLLFDFRLLSLNFCPKKLRTGDEHDGTRGRHFVEIIEIDNRTIKGAQFNGRSGPDIITDRTPTIPPPPMAKPSPKAPVWSASHRLG